MEYANFFPLNIFTITINFFEDIPFFPNYSLTSYNKQINIYFTQPGKDINTATNPTQPP